MTFVEEHEISFVVKKEQPKEEATFGDGLTVKRIVQTKKDYGEFAIYNKQGKRCAYTNVWPIKSFEDSGYFPCVVNKGQNVRFMNGHGEFCFEIYGLNTRGFFNKRAMIQRLKSNDFTFINEQGEELDLSLERASDFIYPGPRAKIVFIGAKGVEDEIDLDGKLVLPSNTVDEEEHEIG